MDLTQGKEITIINKRNAIYNHNGSKNNLFIVGMNRTVILDTRRSWPFIADQAGMRMK